MKYLIGLFITLWMGSSHSVEFITYYGYDQVGNPVVALDRNQGIVATRDTIAYGQKRYHTGHAVAFGDIGFTGQIDRSENKLVYFNSRYYMPKLRRFVSPDPVTVVEGDFKHIDRYGFANGDPINANDPTGNYAESPWDIASAVVGWGMFAYDIGEGNYGDAALSGIGALVDSAAILVPLPGGVSMGIQSTRGVKKLSQAGDASATAKNGLKNADIFDRLSIDGIASINKQFSNGLTMPGKDISTVLANASYREGGINQAASVIRDIAGGHLFQNGNKRTAQALVESFDLGISPETLRGVIDQVGAGSLREVDDVARSLGGP